MPKFFLFLLLIPSLMFASLPEAQSEEELLFARRIIELWRDQEISFTKNQIEIFLTLYPESHFHDHFQAILGDISIKQNFFENALTAYQSIKNGEIRKQVRLKRWYALYQMQSYEQLYQEIRPSLSFLEEEEGFFYFAEAAFRRALTMENSTRQKDCFEEALPHYSRLQTHSQFGPHSQMAMAEIYRYLNRPEKAAALYMTIANEKKNHPALFHAATVLTQCDEQKAIELFSQIAKSGGKKAPEAAYQWLQLLAKNKQWERLIQEQRCFLSTLSERQLPVYHFYAGMVCYEKQDWAAGIISLKKSLSGGLKPPHDKGALLALMLSSREVVDTESVDWAHELIKERYPDQAEESALMRAITYHRAGKNQIALHLLTELIETTTQIHLLEESYLEKLSLLSEEKRWKEGRALALQFLERFPRSPHEPKFIRRTIELSLAALNENGNYSELAQDLERALNKRGLLEEEELDKNRLLLAKCYLKLERVAAARDLLENLLLSHSQSVEVHYLLTLCYLKEGSSPEQVIKHGEKVLVFDPSFEESDRLHLYLFNAYLDLSKESASEKLTESAATHLYAVIDTLPVSLENQLWLAHTYAKQEIYQKRAMKILEKILPSTAQIERFQQEALILAILYENAGRHLDAKKILETLQQLPKKSSHLTTKRELRLASIYKMCGEWERAIPIFERLQDATDGAIAYEARLQLARIGFTTLGEGENPETIFRNLKEIWVHKTLANEPIHLEAALDYADFKATLSPNENQLELLLMIKEHFTSKTDIWSKDYHEARLSDPEKDLLYQAYMRYLDAEIYLAQAKKERGAEAKNKERVAHALFNSLREGKYALSKYLNERVSRRVAR